MEPRTRIVERLRPAWQLVRLSRVNRVIQEASRAVQKALVVASHVLSPSAATDRLARLPEAIEALENTALGNRWALAVELEKLRAERVRSHVLAHALLDLGCCGCDGRRRARDLQRCLSWERTERRRHRVWQKQEALSRQTAVDTLRALPVSLVSEAGMEPEQETNMAKGTLIKRTVIEETFENPEDHEPEEPETDEAEEDEEDDDEEPSPVRRRRNR